MIKEELVTRLVDLLNNGEIEDLIVEAGIPTSRRIGGSLQLEKGPR